MRILFVADGRSPIALDWIEYFVEKDHQVHLVSTYPCASELHLASLHVLLLPLSGFGEAGREQSRSVLRRLVPVGARTMLRQWLVPLSLPRVAQRLQELIEQIQPDLIHAMRIPFEGMLAAMAETARPLLVSVWGNDFTLHAPATSLMRRRTHQVLRRAAAIHTDCWRDLRLAHAWGYPEERPSLVLPGNGGVQLDVFRQTKAVAPGQETLTVINPRGFRAYVRNDTFFKAIPLVLKRFPLARFLCPSMAGEIQAERWVNESGIQGAVKLLPRQSRTQMAALFQETQVAVSVTTHDGTPNTLLEAMACGCFPVAGDLETLREWITPGVNGLLVEADNPAGLAEAIILAAEHPQLRSDAAHINHSLVEQRANYPLGMAKAERFYKQLLKE